MGAPEQGLEREASRPLIAVFVILLVFTIVLLVFSFPAGTYGVFSGKLSTNYTSNSFTRPYLWIGPALAIVPIKLSAGLWFLILTVIYAAFLLYGVRQGISPWRAVARSFREGFGALMSSPFIVMLTSMAFLVFAASVIDDTVTSLGYPPGNPAGDPLVLLIGFTASPMAEEFGFRVVLIGLVALILSIGRPWKVALGSLWRPSKAIEGLAVGSGASIIIWAATGLSAVTFGACHVLCGGATWEPGKFPEAAFGGLVLGFLYVKYGFHVAVITHWGVDYFGSALAFFGQAAYGIPWNSNTSEYIGQYLVDIDMLLLFGLASFIVVLYLGLKRLASRGRGTGALGPDRAQPEKPAVIT